MKALKDLLRLDGRAALVTGGAGYIALAMAEVLVELGAHVLLVDTDQKALDARKKQLGEKVSVRAFDLLDEKAADAIVAWAAATSGRLDVLINNAALTSAGGFAGYAVPFAEQSFGAWQAALQVNLGAVFQLCQTAAPLLQKSGHGSIINVGSIYGVVGPNMNIYEGTPMGNPAAYAATKGGLIQLTRYLSTVLAPAIRVNAMSPGGVERGQPEAFQARYRKLTPLGRMATEEDFKGAVGFLASDASRYVTGQNLCVDGGWTAW